MKYTSLCNSSKCQKNRYEFWSTSYEIQDSVLNWLITLSQLTNINPFLCHSDKGLCQCFEWPDKEVFIKIYAYLNWDGVFSKEWGLRSHETSQDEGTLSHFVGRCLARPFWLINFVCLMDTRLIFGYDQNNWNSVWPQ